MLNIIDCINAKVSSAFKMAQDLAVQPTLANIRLEKAISDQIQFKKLMI
ncbi:MAG TPA: hypothetical protein VF884_10155 [Nitrososphaeraceae archaeon]